MKLYKLYLQDGSTQEIFAFRLGQALACARDGVLVGYTAYGDWE